MSFWNFLWPQEAPKSVVRPAPVVAPVRWSLACARDIRDEYTLGEGQPTDEMIERIIVRHVSARLDP